MAKSFRYDPRDDAGDDSWRRPSSKELKRQRKERQKREHMLDDLLEVEADV